MATARSTCATTPARSQREISAVSAQIGQPLSFAQAQSLGIDRTVQARVLASAALDNEADRIGLSVGDAEVRRQLLTVPAFQGLDGKFDRDTYTLTLRQEGLSETEFEAKLRDEAARTVLQGAILGGTAAPETYVARIAAWATETRDFTVAELIASDLPEPVPAPDEAAIKAYYDAHPDDFTRPETRRISYVWLSPDMLAGDVRARRGGASGRLCRADRRIRHTRAAAGGTAGLSRHRQRRGGEGPIRRRRGDLRGSRRGARADAEPMSTLARCRRTRWARPARRSLR